MPRIYLSPPDVGEREREMLLEAFDSGWIAPLGPDVDAFESELALRAGRSGAVATSSGTAALHLALLVCGVEAGDAVLCSDLTFVASANPILYLGAKPVFVDAERSSWCISPEKFEEAIRSHRPKVAVVVDLYGQCPDWNRLEAIAAEHGVVIIEDAAEALGSTHAGKPAGSFGRLAIFSFNGNKIISTSGGGMLVGDDRKLLDRARFLATQAREPTLHYEHRVVGFNYRMSNLLAAVGRAQLEGLDRKVARRREIFARYSDHFSDRADLEMQPEAPKTVSNRWLSCLTVKSELVTPSTLIAALDQQDIEARPVWKPMHLQPLFSSAAKLGGEVGADLFARGVCLPSGSSLIDADVDRIAEIVLAANAARSPRLAETGAR